MYYTTYTLMGVATAAQFNLPCFPSLAIIEPSRLLQ